MRPPVRCTCRVASAIAATAAAAVYQPLFVAFFLRPATTGFRSAHPRSPHTPPSLALDAAQLERWRADGMLVLRRVLPPELAARLARHGADLVANRTCGASFANIAAIRLTEALLLSRAQDAVRLERLGRPAGLPPLRDVL